MTASETIDKGIAESKDPATPFNASLEGNARRAIGIHEGGGIDRAAVTLDTSTTKRAK
jgi:hypothetical protein